MTAVIYLKVIKIKLDFFLLNELFKKGSTLIRYVVDLRCNKLYVVIH